MLKRFIMKKLNNLFNSTNIIKVLVIFSVGFIYRIIIYHYLGVNVFLEYANSISILYYFGLFSFSVYFDQLFSYQFSVPTDMDYTFKSLSNDYKTTNLLFTKHHKSNYSLQSPTGNSSGHSKTSRKYVTTNDRYIYLRPAVNGKGDIVLVPGLSLGKHSSESVLNMPSVPKPSNLSSPSTMSPLFTSPLKRDLTNSIHTKPMGNIPAPNDKSHSFRRNTFDTADLADRRRRLIKSVQLKIKESNTTKSSIKNCFLDKISSGLKFVDSKVVSKLLNEPTGVLDPRNTKAKIEYERRAYLYRESQHKESIT